MPIQLVSLRDARSTLAGDRMVAIVQSAQDSVRVWREDMQPHQMVLTPTTRAGFINNYFYPFLSARLAEDDGYRFDESQGQRYCAFDERLLVRFKLFGQELESRNYPTSQARGFVEQRVLDGFPPLARLHIGYRLDLTGMNVVDLFVTLPIGKRNRFNAWVWQVWGDPIRDTETYPIPLPLDPARFPQRDEYLYEDYRRFVS